MKPPKHATQYEKVAIGEFINGEIQAIQYDQEHKFIFNKVETIAPGVRIVFMLDGYQYPKYSRWMRFNYGEKANLYKLILFKLVEGAFPDMDFDLDCIRNMRVKTLWNENNNFQNLESIFPLDTKVPLNTIPPTVESMEGSIEPGAEEEIPEI